MNVINYREYDPFGSVFAVLYRSDYYIFSYYLIGAVSIILIFLPLFYMTLKVDEKNKYLYIFLFYFAALMCTLLLSSMNIYWHINSWFFNVSSPFYELTGVFVLTPLTLFAIFSAIFKFFKSIKIKVPVVCILTLALQILYCVWFYTRPVTETTSIITEILIWLVYIGVPAFPLTVSLYIKHYATLPNEKD